MTFSIYPICRIILMGDEKKTPAVATRIRNILFSNAIIQAWNNQTRCGIKGEKKKQIINTFRPFFLSFFFVPKRNFIRKWIFDREKKRNSVGGKTNKNLGPMKYKINTKKKIEPGDTYSCISLYKLQQFWCGGRRRLKEKKFHR